MSQIKDSDDDPVPVVVVPPQSLDTDIPETVSIVEQDDEEEHQLSPVDNPDGDPMDEDSSSVTASIEDNSMKFPQKET